GIERRIEVAPVRARVLAPVKPSLGAGEEDSMLSRMHRDRAHRSFVGEAAPRPDAHPGLAVVLAPHDALADGADHYRDVLHLFPPQAAEKDSPASFRLARFGSTY